VIIFNLQPMGNFDKLPRKFTFFQDLVIKMEYFYAFLVHFI